MNIIFKRIKAGSAVSDRPLRDEVIEGIAHDLPVRGQPFVFFAAPRDSGDFRLVTTSEVEASSNEGYVYQIQTKSGSMYEIDFVDGII